MKRWLSVLVLSWVLIGVAGVTPVAADSYSFVHDTDGYINIATAADLTAFAAGINDGTLAAATNARLTDNIVLRDTDGWGTWSDATQPNDIEANPAWTPIGNTTNSYKGTFDGAGHTVSGIYINASLKAYQGLFGSCFQATIENLAVTKSYINGG